MGRTQALIGAALIALLGFAWLVVPRPDLASSSPHPRATDEPEERVWVDELPGLFSRFADEARDDPRFASAEGTVRHYAQRDTVNAFVGLFEPLIVERTPDYESSFGIDLGSWYGLSTFVLSALGAERVVGLDVIPEFVDASRFFLAQSGKTGLAFEAIEKGQLGTLPVESDSADWLVTNDVFSNANPDRFPFMLDEIHRVLRPGGSFYLSDNNNPHHEGTRERLKQAYREYEIGTGSEAQPSGQYFLARKAILGELFPGLTEARLSELARRTAHLWGEDLERTGRELLGGDERNAQRFETEALRAPIAPTNGSSIGAVTDPIQLASMARRSGFTRVELFLEPGASRPSPLTIDALRHSGRFFLVCVK